MVQRALNITCLAIQFIRLVIQVIRLARQFVRFTIQVVRLARQVICLVIQVTYLAIRVFDSFFAGSARASREVKVSSFP